jgi:hypothetical protein
MPIFGCINLTKRTAESEAGIYKVKPKRTFLNATEDQVKVLNQVYEDLCIDDKMLRANQHLKVQEQTHLNIIVSNGKLKIRNILNHQLDVVPSAEDPETGECYIVSGFDKRQNSQSLISSDGVNQTIGDKDDEDLTRFSLWSNSFNFLMNKYGSLLSTEIDNKIGMIPFVELTYSKVNEYWLRSGTSLTDFTIQFNATLSDLSHIVRMQGFAQAFFKGNINTIPELLTVGPNHIIKLGIDPNNPTDTEFGFASPSPDLAGSIQFVEVLLSAFLTSRGLDPKLVNTKSDASKSFSSGVERLLSMIDSFGPSKADFPIFETAEKRIFEIVKAYLNTYSGSNVLNYNSGTIPEDVTLAIEFHEPQMIMTQSDKLDIIQKKTDLGLTTKLMSIKELYSLDDSQAQEMLTKIEAEEPQFGLGAPIV